MGYHFRGREQAVPEEIRRWADAGVWKLVEVVEQVDVSGFEQDYRADGSGGQPYDPRLMLVSVWWCYQHGVRGPQEIARSCREQVSLRMVWGREQVPSAATFRRFIGGHPQGWQRVQVVSVALCAQAGLVDVTTTATDSTPVDSPAGLSTVESGARLTVAVAQLNERLVALRAEAAQAAQQGCVELLCDKLRRAEARLLNRLARLRAAEAQARARDAQAEAIHPHAEQIWVGRIERHEHTLAQMIARQQQAVEAYQAKVAAGHKPRGGPPCTPEQHAHIRAKTAALARAREKLAAARAHPTRRRLATRVAPADPQARIVKGKNTTTWVLGLLLTLTVALGQVILAGILSPLGNDAGGLHPNLAAAAACAQQAGITQIPLHHLADGGFASEQTFTTASPFGGQLYINVPTDDQTRHPSSATAARHHMAERLHSEQGQRIYRLRAPTIEPVFAHLLRTDRRLHTHGPAQHTEILAITSAYNIGKYLRYRHARTRPRQLTQTAH
jgi:transposase